jgi:hypothetical protein
VLQLQRLRTAADDDAAGVVVAAASCQLLTICLLRLLVTR